MSSRARPSARQRREAARLRKQRQQRLIYAGVIVVVAVLVVVIAIAAGSSKKTNVTSNGPLLAPAGAGSPTGAPIDGITCGAMEQLAYHIHAHLAVFVNGQPKTIPATIGFTNSCLYWLHSHTPDGVIHIESPVQHIYTLGNYFDVWGQPLSSTQVGPVTGPVTAYLNGQRYSGDPRQIPLEAHNNIQLDVGTAVAPESFTFPSGL